MRCCSLLLLLLAGACEPREDLPEAMFDTTSAELFDAPWPSDMRVDADGYPDLSGFPNGFSLPILDQYAAVAESQKGYGTNSPIYFRFSDSIAESKLPYPEDSIADGSPLLLVDIDRDSPHRGERFPVQWVFRDDWKTYLPGNQLAMAPVFGFPLRPGTTYAAVVTTEVADPSPAFAEVWSTEHPHHELYAELEDMLPDLGLTTEDIAVATTFTTQDPTREMAAVAQTIRTELDVPVLDQVVTTVEDGATSFYEVYTGSYDTPNFQHGERPYATVGGGFRFAEDGSAEIYEWETIRFSVCTPLDLSSPPEGGWPVVVYQHGTGGNFRSFCNEAGGIEVASQLARYGMVGIGIDQPLHGKRATEDTDTSLHSFNYLNPESVRANFRQGAADAIYLVRALASRETLLTTDAGETIPLDDERVMFMGHSQGGLTGAIAAPFMDEAKAVMLSGAGGGLAITIVERKDPVDISGALRTVLKFMEDEEVDELHPVVGLIQSLVEVTDPINYAPYWWAIDGGFGGTPQNVLLTSGRNDAQTPHRTAEAMAAAARMPILAPGMNQPIAHDLADLATQTGPLTENVTAWDGSPRTSALSQWANDDHWAIFDNAEAAKQYRHFLWSTAYEVPTIDDTPPN